MTPEPQDIVIIGGGIIGCTTAYYLTRHPQYTPTTRITILESTSIAAASSGKAGGLLADWAYPSSLASRSFSLHKQLASEHDGAKNYGYREVKCGSIEAKVPVGSVDGRGNMEGVEWDKLPKQDDDARGKLKRAVLPADLDYVDDGFVTGWSEMEGQTAQVHPFQFTNFMATKATEAGVNIVLRAHVTSINHKTSPATVTYTNRDTGEPTTLPAHKILLAAGPWTSKLMPSLPIGSVQANSVVYKAEVAPYAVFTSISLPKVRGKRLATVDPEAYARPDGTIYACGPAKAVPLPKYADDDFRDEPGYNHITTAMSLISPAIRNAEILKEQSCWLPQFEESQVSGPLLGRIGNSAVYVAAGHTCWGIQNGPATGELMASVLFDERGSLGPGFEDICARDVGIVAV